MTTSNGRLTLARLCAAFLLHAEEYYRRADGTQTREALNIRSTLRSLQRCVDASKPAESVTSDELASWMTSLATGEMRRTTINQRLGQIKRMYQWGKRSKLLTARGIAEVLATEPLKPFRSPAKESPRVRFAHPIDTVWQICQHVPPASRELVELLALTGARVSEIAKLTPNDIVLEAGQERIVLEAHKTAHKGRSRVIPLSRRSLEIIRRRMPSSPTAHLFPSRVAGRPVTPGHIRKMIREACLAAGVTVVSTHSIRHSVARAVRGVDGLDTASSVLGHADIRMTERYAPLPISAAIRGMQIAESFAMGGAL